jgi:hypothetical protein
MGSAARRILAMCKRRRFWVVVACGLALLFVPLLAYRLWWYPSTPRGAVDRIRMGMTAAEVRAILDPLEEGGSRGSLFPVRAERWVIKDGEVVHAHSDKQPDVSALYIHLCNRRVVPWLGFERPGAKFLDLDRGGPFLGKMTRDAFIFVELDEQQRVCGKIWLEFPRESSNPLERFWSWLPF